MTLFAGRNLWRSEQWKPAVHTEIRLVFLPAELLPYVSRYTGYLQYESIQKQYIDIQKESIPI